MQLKSYMIHQDIFISPLLLMCSDPKIHLKKSKYKIPDIFPPHLMLNEQINQLSFECTKDNNGKSTNSEEEFSSESEIDCKKFKSNIENEESLDAMNILLRLKKNSSNNDLKDIKGEKGYTILDLLKLTCK